MFVRDVMTTQVTWVGEQESAAVAARLLSRCNVGALPVCAADGTLRGLITDRDIVLRCVAADRDVQKTPVRELMTHRVVTVSPDADAVSAARLMRAEQVRRLPVTQGGRVVGMVALADLAARPDYAMEAAACLTEISVNLRRR